MPADGSSGCGVGLRTKPSTSPVELVGAGVEFAAPPLRNEPYSGVHTGENRRGSLLCLGRVGGGTGRSLCPDRQGGVGKGPGLS